MSIHDTSTSSLAQLRAGRGSADKFLTFALHDEVYGLPILSVQEIIRIMDITPVPHVPDFIRGVINLRGKVLPVVELRTKFGMEKIEDSKRTCIIVVQIQAGADTLTMGLIVDEVNEVQNIAKDNIEPPPSFGSSTIDTSFILGVAKLQKRVVMLLDINKVLSEQHLTEVSEQIQ